MYKLYVCEKGYGTRKIGFFDTLEQAKKALKEDAKLFFEFFKGECKYTITCDEFVYNVKLSNL